MLAGRVGAALLFAFAGTAAAAEPVPPRLAPCLACHGEQGISSVAEVPSLGGQPAFYLTAQLIMFREKLRAVEPMNQLMQGISDAEVRSMAAFLSKLPAPAPVAGAADAERIERARALVEQHRCNFCHNRDFSGADGAPRLAGQREDYLVKALRAYKGNVRRAYDPSMADVLYTVSDEQMLDLAYFLARFR